MTIEVEIIKQLIFNLSLSDKISLFEALNKSYKKILLYSSLTDGERRCFGDCEFSDITKELEKEVFKN